MDSNVYRAEFILRPTDDGIERVFKIVGQPFELAILLRRPYNLEKGINYTSAFEHSKIRWIPRY